MKKDNLKIIVSEAGVVDDVRSMILETRERVSRVVNTGMALLYWRVGKRL